MTFKVVTTKETKARVKKLPEISKNIIETVNASTNEVVAIQVIKGIYNGVNNDIPVVSMYVDSNGDLVKKSIIDGRTLVEIEMCEQSIKQIEELCDMNISDDNSSNITRKRIHFSANEVEVCRVTLGFFRLYLQKLDIKAERKTHQDASGKTIYESVVKCKPEDIQKVTKIIKDFNKPNMIVEWY